MAAYRCLVLAALAAASAACSQRTFEWREEIKLGSGESFWITRSARLEAEGEWANSSYSRAIDMRVELPEPGAGLAWTGNDWPVSLDRVDGQWWIVVPVHGAEACVRYDFPLAGVVAFALDDSGWSQRNPDGLLDRLIVNLGRPQLDDGRYERIAFSWGAKRNNVGMTVAASIKPRLRQAHACNRLRPPNSAKPTSLAAFAALAPADRSPVLESISADLTPAERTEGEKPRASSIRVRNIHLLRGCESSVRLIDPFVEWSPNGSQWDGGTRIDFAGADPDAERPAFIPQSATVYGIACEPDRALVVVASGQGRLRWSIVEYRDAVPVQAWSYRLAELDTWFAPERGLPVALQDRGDAFAITLMNEAATKRVRLQLPKGSQPIAAALPIGGEP
jgi:hypothetical protein